MRTRIIEVLLAVAAMTFAAGFSALAAQEEAAPALSTGGEATPANTAPAPPPGWLERDTLSGDWGGGRPWLKERGITLKPRLTQFYQGMFSGDGDHSFEYGGKADLLFDAQVSAKFPHPRNTHSIDAAQSARDRRGIRQWVES